MIDKLIHFSDLHIRLFKDHDLYKGILKDMFKQIVAIGSDTIVRGTKETGSILIENIAVGGR